MGRTLILFILIVTLNSSLYAESKWRLIKHEDDIQVFTHQTLNTQIKSAKGIVLISTKLNDLLKVLEDVKKLPLWLYNCKSAKTIKQLSIVERYDYIVTDIPWPNWDRDVVVRSIFQQDRATKVVKIKFDTIPNQVSLKSGIVRIKKMTGYMQLIPQDSSTVKIIYEVNADPGGRIPKWMVNDMVSDFPFYSLRKLRKLIEK